MARYVNVKTGKEVETLEFDNAMPNFTYFLLVRDGRVVGKWSVAMPTETFVKTYIAKDRP